MLFLPTLRGQRGCLNGLGLPGFILSNTKEHSRSVGHGVNGVKDKSRRFSDGFDRAQARWRVVAGLGGAPAEPVVRYRRRKEAVACYLVPFAAGTVFQLRVVRE